MNQRLQPFIANAIRTITQSLQSTAAETTKQLKPSHGGSDSVQPYPNYLQLDCSSAEVVIGGSLVFPDTACESETDWCVLQSYTVGRNRNGHLFKFRGRLSAKLNSEDFVRFAYEFIFGRPVDESGLTIYPPLVESRQRTRRELLKILVASDEAKALDVLMIIIPHPSSWLQGLNIDPDDDSSFPFLLADIYNK